MSSSTFFFHLRTLRWIAAWRMNCSKSSGDGAGRSAQATGLGGRGWCKWGGAANTPNSQGHSAREVEVNMRFLGGSSRGPLERSVLHGGYDYPEGCCSARWQVDPVNDHMTCFSYMQLRICIWFWLHAIYQCSIVTCDTCTVCNIAARWWYKGGMELIIILGSLRTIDHPVLFNWYCTEMCYHDGKQYLDHPWLG